MKYEQIIRAVSHNGDFVQVRIGGLESGTPPTSAQKNAVTKLFREAFDRQPDSIAGASLPEIKEDDDD